MARAAHRLALAVGLGLALLQPACSPPRPPSIAYDLVRTIPHDPQAFTQGLVFHRGYLYESTGLYGQSSLRQLDPRDGRVLRRRALPAHLFGEGLAHFDGRLYQLTWREGLVLVVDAETWADAGARTLDGEGWGLAAWGDLLLRSDGTDRLHVHDPVTLAPLREIPVRDGDRPLTRLNELEVVEGTVFANVWGSDRIARVDPESGRVTGWLDGAALVPAPLRGSREAVLNGIAYDPATKRLFVTGKNWPVLHELRLRD